MFVSRMRRTVYMHAHSHTRTHTHTHAPHSHTWTHTQVQIKTQTSHVFSFLVHEAQLKLNQKIPKCHVTHKSLTYTEVLQDVWFLNIVVHYVYVCACVCVRVCACVYVCVYVCDAIGNSAIPL